MSRSRKGKISRKSSAPAAAAAAAAEMRAVRGEVVSSKPVALTKAARVFSLFAASDASGLPSDGGALLQCAAEAALELLAFRRYATRESEASGGQSAEKRAKKRKRKKDEAGQ